jgi:hypothetical protein
MQFVTSVESEHWVLVLNFQGMTIQLYKISFEVKLVFFGSIYLIFTIFTLIEAAFEETLVRKFI